MKLDEHYSVKHDGVQWTLSYEKESEKINPKTNKNEVTKKQFYHNTLGSALSSYMNKKVEVCETVDEAIIVLQDLLVEVDIFKYK